VFRKKKLKIAIFHCSMVYSGGGERIVLGQIEGLRKRGYEVSCFTPIFDKKRCYPDVIDNYPIYTFLPQLPEFFPFRHGILLLLTSLFIPFLAFRFRKFDLFIGENQPGTWLAFVVSKILRKPYIIYTCHPNKIIYPRKLSRKQIWKNQPDFYWLSILFEPFKPVLKFLDRLSFSGSKLSVLTNGFFIGREFGRIYHVRWKGCPCGASVIPWEEIKKNFQSIYKRPYILFIGRHEVWKRIDLVIKAMVKIVKKMPNVDLIIPGPYTNHTYELIALTKKLGLEEKVKFIGEVNQEELSQLYQKAVVFVFSSKREDFGIAMVEAMSYGVPVVAWNSGGPTDIVLDGKTGFLATPFSLDDFAEKTIRILKDKRLRRKMSLGSWQRVRDHFSWKRHLDILEEEIKKALSLNLNKKEDYVRKNF